MAEWTEFERAPPDLRRWYWDRRYTEVAAAAVEVEAGLGQVAEHVEYE